MNIRRLASTHAAGRLETGASIFFCILFLCQAKKRMPGFGADSPKKKPSGSIIKDKSPNKKEGILYCIAKFAYIKRIFIGQE